MDPESARLVRDAIHELRSANRSIIICTHNLAEAEELAGKIAIIHLGKIIISGDVQEIKLKSLGAPQFEVRLGVDQMELKDSLPQDARLIAQGEGWFQFQTDTPIETNPLVIEALVKRKIPVIGLTEVSRSLEKVYLQAITAAQGNGYRMLKSDALPDAGDIRNAG